MGATQGDRPVSVSGGSQEMVIVSCSGVIVGANQHARVEGHGTAWIAVGGP